MTDPIREAFRAGWMASAIPADEIAGGPERARACEEADWREWIRERAAQGVETGRPESDDARRREAYRAGWRMNVVEFHDRTTQDEPYFLTPTGRLFRTWSHGEILRIHDPRIGVLYDAQADLVIDHGGAGEIAAVAGDTLNRLTANPSPLAGQLREDLAVVTVPATPATIAVLNRFATISGRPGSPTIPEELRAADTDVVVSPLRSLAVPVAPGGRRVKPH